MRAIQQREFGGPEVLEVVELPRPEPGDGEVLIRVTRAGLNFADTHTRENTYLAEATLPLLPPRAGSTSPDPHPRENPSRAGAPLPLGPGAEVAGVREDTGERVVALCGTGGYAEYAPAPAALTFPIPAEVDDGTALALLLQG